MTSAEDFPDEPRVPPVVLNIGDLFVGSIIAINKDEGGDLRLGITVRDDNVDDVLEVRTTLSVLGESPYEFVCSGEINPSKQPERDRFHVNLNAPQIRTGACTKVDVFVSSQFRDPCLPIKPRVFDLPSVRDDVALATFWIWEMSGDPARNAVAAQNLLASCQTMMGAQPTPMPIGP